MNLGILLSPGDSLTRQDRTGQWERFVNYYLKEYTRHFDRVFIFSYGDSQFNQPLPAGVELIPKPGGWPNYLYLVFLPLIHRRIIKKLAVIRVLQAPGGLAAAVAKFLFNRPFVVTYGYDYVAFAKIEKHQFLAWILSWLVPVVLKSADKIIVTDKALAAGYLTTLIPNGVDPAQFRPGGSRQPRLVLSVGRLARQKNYLRLIEAVGQSRWRGQIQLVIIGEGEEAARLKKRAAELKVKLQLIANVSHSRLVKWYQRAAVFCLPSLAEGQSKTLLESMSCGCPCLTTNFSGNPITHRQTGLIADDVKVLSAGLDWLLSHPGEAERIGQEARSLIVRRFDIRQLLAKEIKLLHSCRR